MTRKQMLMAVVAPIAGVLLSAGAASALPLPDTSACGGSIAGGCLTITTNGDNTTSGMRGNGAAGMGLHGVSTNNNGVRGQTGSFTAAAVSALSPSNSGLAYWGTGNITITGATALKAGGGAWGVFSDGRIKKDVKDFHPGLEQLEKVRAVTFKYNGLGGTEADGREYVGVIAQELERIFPSMVSSQKRKLHEDDSQETDIKIVDPNAFTYVLINAVKEQQEIIEQQERRISALERPRSSLSSSVLGGGVGVGLLAGLLPLAFLASRRRKASAQTAD